jgi:hypothetical protein
MKYELLIRSRAFCDETIEQKHTRFMAGLRSIPPPWGLEGKEVPAPPDPGEDLIADVQLGRFFGNGIPGEIVYQYRHHGFRDEGADDDYFALKFNPEKLDYERLVHVALPIYLSSFSAYRGQIGNVEFGDKDWDAGERDVDYRHGVFRIYPVSFFDRQLCVRAFGLQPEAIISRLEGKVEKVELYNDGVLIVSSSRPLPLEAADQVSRDVWAALGARSPTPSLA